MNLPDINRPDYLYLQMVGELLCDAPYENENTELFLLECALCGHLPSETPHIPPWEDLPENVIPISQNTLVNPSKYTLEEKSEIVRLFNQSIPKMWIGEFPKYAFPNQRAAQRPSTNAYYNRRYYR